MYNVIKKKRKKHYYKQIMYSAPSVRRNVFKTEEKKGTEEKALKAMEFPEFHCKSNPVKKSVLQETISYMDVTNKEKQEEETKENKLEEGWCRLSWDSKRKLVIERSEEDNSKKPKPKPKLSYHEYVSTRMQQLFDKWDEYKREFIEMNGEDAYPRMKMVFDDNIKEEEENDYEENEDDYYCDV